MSRRSVHSPAAEVLIKSSRGVRWPRLIAAAAWSVFALIHVLALLFFAVSALGYWALRDRGVSNFLESNRIGMHPQHYSTIALALASIALVHTWLLLRMVVLSARSRRLVYSQSQSQMTPLSSGSGVVQKIWRVLLRAYDAIFSPSGLLGVSGPCFDLLLLLREVVETALQTAQAYRMSQFLARAWLNRFYVSLVVLNCWLVVVVHTLFHARPVTR